MVDVYVGIGSNIDPERHIAQALELLRARFGRLRCSRVYQSPPLGFAGADFLNLVVVFATALPVAAVDAALAAAESAGGRAPAGERAASRTLDLDLLIYGARVDPALRLPRADVLAYPFVLAPLAELDPGLRHPVTGIAIAAAWERMAATQPPLTCRGAVAAVG